MSHDDNGLCKQATAKSANDQVRLASSAHNFFFFLLGWLFTHKQTKPTQGIDGNEYTSVEVKEVL